MLFLVGRRGQFLFSSRQRIRGVIICDCVYIHLVAFLGGSSSVVVVVALVYGYSGGSVWDAVYWGRDAMVDIGFCVAVVWC